MMLFGYIDLLCLNNRAKQFTDRGYSIDLALLRDAFFMIKCGILIDNLKTNGYDFALDQLECITCFRGNKSHLLIAFSSSSSITTRRFCIILLK